MEVYRLYYANDMGITLPWDIGCLSVSRAFRPCWLNSVMFQLNI